MKFARLIAFLISLAVCSQAEASYDSNFIKATGATVTRDLADHLANEYFAANYGVKCDGSTDNTTNINAALTRISAGGTVGFKFMFPSGVCMASHITQPRLSILACAGGDQACTLKQIAGSNQNFIASENFSVLVGTGLNYGPDGTFNGFASDHRVPSLFGFSGLHIDGNATGGNSTGHCIAYYGNGQLYLGHNLIENCAESSMFTQASNAPAYSKTDWKSQEEGYGDHIIIRNSGGKGIDFEGPHDTFIEDYVGVENADCSFHNESGTHYNGNLSIGFIYTYTEDNGCGQDYQTGVKIVGGTYIDHDDLTVGSGGPGTIINSINGIETGVHSRNAVNIAANNVVISNAHVIPQINTGINGIKLFNITGTGVQINNMYGELYNLGTNNTGLYNRGTGNIFSGQINGGNGISGSSCMDIGATYNTVNVTGFNCNNFVTLASGEFANTWNIHSFGATKFVNAPSANVVDTFDGSDTIQACDSTFTNCYMNTLNSYRLGGDIILSRSGANTFSLGNSTSTTTLQGATIAALTGTTQRGLWDANGLTLGVAGTTKGQLNIAGSSSGTIAISPQAVAGTYNFNLPAGAGTAGFPMLSGGGGASPMTFGILGAAAGGTGQSSLANHGVLVGAGTSGITQLSAAASGTVLTGAGASSDPSFTATPILGVSGTTKGIISLTGDTSGVVTIQPGTAAGTWTITLPTSAGNSGQVLKTDGTGVTTWATVGPVTIKTSTYAIQAVDSGSTFTNTGASGSVPFTLPTAAPALDYCFYSDVAQPIVVTADSGHTIRNGASVTASSGNLTSNGAIGSRLCLKALNTTEWFVTGITGSWTVN